MSRLKIESAPEFAIKDESALFKAAPNASANLVEFVNSSNTVVASFSQNGNVVVAGNMSVTGNITVTGSTVASANAGTLVGSTLSGNVLFSSLTSLGNLTSLTVTGNTTSNNVTVNNNLIVWGKFDSFWNNHLY